MRCRCRADLNILLLKQFVFQNGNIRNNERGIYILVGAKLPYSIGSETRYNTHHSKTEEEVSELLAADLRSYLCRRVRDLRASRNIHPIHTYEAYIRYTLEYM